jgi:heme-degrading monooxygenase HmoA
VSVVLLIAHTSVDPARDKEFNEWYDREHIRDVLKFDGVVSARRYKKLRGDDPHQYIAIYEFASEEAADKFFSSEYRKEIYAKHLERFGPFPEPGRDVYIQVWP